MAFLKFLVCIAPAEAGVLLTALAGPTFVGAILILATFGLTMAGGSVAAILTRKGA